MVIKGWSITVGMALIGYAFQQQKRSILLLCVVSSICFAFVDAKFKEFQVSYYPRLEAIEKCKAFEFERVQNSTFNTKKIVLLCR